MTKFYPHGSLRDVLDGAPLPLAMKLRMARDIAWGMEYLHCRHNEAVRRPTRR